MADMTMSDPKSAHSPPDRWDMGFAAGFEHGKTETIGAAHDLAQRSRARAETAEALLQDTAKMLQRLEEDWRKDAGTLREIAYTTSNYDRALIAQKQQCADELAALISRLTPTTEVNDGTVQG